MIEYEEAKSMADEIVASIQVCSPGPANLPNSITSGLTPIPHPFPITQERNLKHPHGGPDASRITAAARRQLGMLATGIGSIQAHLEADRSM